MIQTGILFGKDRNKQTTNFLNKLVNLTNQVSVNFTKTNQVHISVSRVKTRMYRVKYVLNIFHHITSFTVYSPHDFINLTSNSLLHIVNLCKQREN